MLQDQLSAPNAELHIRQMTLLDLPFCRHLVREAGWNQLDGDWLRAMELDAGGCFVAETGQTAVATTTSCRFGEVGWIAMVLVDQKARGRRIAERLVRHAIHYLESNGVRSVRLDATNMGQGLYQKLGFVDEYEVIRYAGTPERDILERPAMEQIIPNRGQMKQIAAFDQNATGTYRQAFLENLTMDRNMPFYCKFSDAGTVMGYAASREGGNAVQIGPVIAKTSNEGSELLRALTACFAGKRCFIDIPSENKSAVEWAQANNFTEQRRFVRMCRGEKTQDRPSMIWAGSGPEKG